MAEAKPENFVERMKEAIIKRIEGAEDPRRKWDYLMNPKNLKTSSILSEVQEDSIAACNWLGLAFPSLSPLADYANEQAQWSPSKVGKGREQLTATMISEHKEIVPMMAQFTQEKSKKPKEVKTDGT